MGRGPTLAGIAAVALLAGCTGQTDPASDVRASSATLNARGRTDDEPARYRFQYARAAADLGTSRGSTTPERGPVPANFPSGGGQIPFGEIVRGLLPATSYAFRVCATDEGEAEVCADTETLTTAPAPRPATFAVTNRPAGPRPNDARVADLNEDGRPDVVVVQGTEPWGVNVLLGDGAGGLSAPTRYSAGTGLEGTIELAVAEFTSDGNLDVVAVNGFTGRAVLLRGDGQGRLGPPTTVASGLGTRTAIGDPVTGDLDEDGRTDMLIAGRLYLGDGAGGFTSRAIPGGDGSWKQVADLDGDGHLDLVLGRDLRAAVLYGDGDGGFPQSTDLAVPSLVIGGQGAPRVALGDVDGDRDLDVALAIAQGNRFPQNEGYVTAWLNEGRARFTATTDYARSTFLPRGGLVVADVTRDGRADLVVAAYRQVNVLAGDGNGSFAPAVATPTAEVSTLVTADLDRDGRPDLVAPSSFDAAALVVLLNRTPPG